MLRSGLLALAALVAVVLVRSFGAASAQEHPEPPIPLDFDRQAAVAHFARGIAIPTISFAEDSGESLDAEAFRSFRQHLEESYPVAHGLLHREIVSGHSLLYHWAGTEPSLEPILLMGHMDVVPVEEGSQSEWTHPPFSGRVADGFIWGRGTLDDKLNVFGLLEAAEALAREGFRPRRSILLAFGHDEELGGPEGAQAIAALLQSRGVRLDFVVDEGGSVASGILPGADFPVAAVSIAEKGYVSIELLVETEGGHSSTPPRSTAIGLLATAVHQLERAPMASHFEGPMRQLLEELAPRMSLGYRVLFSNLWLFGPLVEQVLGGLPQGSAAIRTTTAPTLFHGGVKDNVLPSRARAVVNFRIYPGESIQSVVTRVRETVRDPRVEVRALPKQREPTDFSSAESESYALLSRTIRQIYPDAVVAPYLALGGTDSRYLRPIARDVYGFMPGRLRPEDFKRIHGKNERVAVDDFLDGVRFYAQLMRNGAG
jgi:carboxypeptidase PM20D1